MNSKYLPEFAQASPITIKWLLLKRLGASQFLVNIKLPKLDHSGTGKHGILCSKNNIVGLASTRSSLELLVSPYRKLHPGLGFLARHS